MALTGQTIVSVKSTSNSLIPIHRMLTRRSLTQSRTPKSRLLYPSHLRYPPAWFYASRPSVLFPVDYRSRTTLVRPHRPGNRLLSISLRPHSNTIRTHTPLLTTFAAIVIVLAAIGVDDNLFSPASSQKLTAVAWIMTAIVDCLWVLSLTAGDGTRTRRVFDYLIGGSGLFGSRAREESTPMFETSKFTSVLGRVPRSRLRRRQRKKSQVGSPKDPTPNFDNPGDTFVAAPPPSEGTRTSKSQRGSTVPSVMASVVGDGTRASIVT
jgi:SHO1 osmosensor